ncbi:hypothetical protein AYL99_02135 [Fonsecaea erecta]|uniref:Alpha-1,3-mannosyltransferase n=1 Tax=Fonsecaea erecta TaxID=1367422 RepID=A0A178ZSW1_9EURO|nr:hypothetical protein AYL99_02135 [Fonsecaea erecta]OAP62908.1 hypothetical protein AYL99_02135 [Fonsecaea erecta]
MPPHLHPRSTATSTLFAGTLLASFIVVGIPHVFPCPRPRTGYAADAGRIELDEEGNPTRVVRRPQGSITRPGVDRLSSSSKITQDQCVSRATKEGEQRQQQPQQPQQPRTAPQIVTKRSLTAPKDLDEEAALFRELQAEAEVLEREARSARECPVPKPRGWVGRMLGFEEQQSGKVAVDKEGG